MQNTEYADFNWEKCTLHVQPKARRKFRLKGKSKNKSAKDRFIPIPAKLVSKIKDRMRERNAQPRDLVFPNGETQTILRVPAYNWHWQLWYNLSEPIVLPKGTKIECTAHFDNSPNNRENPDPTKTVIWGQQNWDEMMVGFFNLVFDAKMPVKELLRDHQAETTAAHN